ncbi:hypothetical protein [Psychrosphaera algicola]|uniref:Tetratricopeptide repeat protein n=2 Tax=Psychrosphaera TaxID=907197 RepID=A0ABT5FE69_9GAMM|nr:hypothetical protein [Psychrosphaera sp. G1-22]MDC2889808.1 hypothetical protein [Psychrosphaera sp. G1-22]
MNIKSKLLTLSMTIAISGSALAGQAEIDRIEQAAGVLDITQLKTIAADLSGYDLALAYYRIALSANLKGQTPVAKESIDQAMELLEKLDESSPDNVEIKALLAQVYGYKIALDPIKGMYYGPKSNSTLSSAETIQPNNPRVLLVKGISKFNTPGVFGGSTEAAYQAFDQAITAYSEDQYSDYHWG